MKVPHLADPNVLPGFWSFDGRCFVKGQQVDRVAKMAGTCDDTRTAAHREFRTWLRMTGVTFVEIVLMCNERPEEVWVVGRLRVVGVR